jgi:hypothetical protein
MNVWPTLTIYVGLSRSVYVQRMTVHLVIYLVIHLVIFLPKVLHIHGIYTYILGRPDPCMCNVYDRTFGDLFGDFPA